MFHVPGPNLVGREQKLRKLLIAGKNGLFDTSNSVTTTITLPDARFQFRMLHKTFNVEAAFFRLTNATLMGLDVELPANASGKVDPMDFQSANFPSENVS